MVGEHLREPLDYLYEELPPEKMAEVRVHLADCPECRAQMRTIRETVKLYRRADHPIAPVGLSSRTIKNILQAARAQTQATAAQQSTIAAKKTASTPPVATKNISSVQAPPAPATDPHAEALLTQRRKERDSAEFTRFKEEILGEVRKHNRRSWLFHPAWTVAASVIFLCSLLVHFIPRTYRQDMYHVPAAALRDDTAIQLRERERLPASKPPAPLAERDLPPPEASPILREAEVLNQPPEVTPAKSGPDTNSAESASEGMEKQSVVPDKKLTSRHKTLQKKSKVATVTSIGNASADSDEADMTLRTDSPELMPHTTEQAEEQLEQFFKQLPRQAKAEPALSRRLSAPPPLDSDAPEKEFPASFRAEKSAPPPQKPAMARLDLKHPEASEPAMAATAREQPEKGRERPVAALSRMALPAPEPAVEAPASKPDAESPEVESQVSVIFLDGFSPDNVPQLIERPTPINVLERIRSLTALIGMQIASGELDDARQALEILERYDAKAAEEMRKLMPAISVDGDCGNESNKPKAVIGTPLPKDMPMPRDKPVPTVKTVPPMKAPPSPSPSPEREQTEESPTEKPLVEALPESASPIREIPEEKMEIPGEETPEDTDVPESASAFDTAEFEEVKQEATHTEEAAAETADAYSVTILETIVPGSGGAATPDMEPVPITENSTAIDFDMGDLFPVERVELRDGKTIHPDGGEGVQEVERIISPTAVEEENVSEAGMSAARGTTAVMAASGSRVTVPKVMEPAAPLDGYMSLGSASKQGAWAAIEKKGESADTPVLETSHAIGDDSAPEAPAAVYSSPTPTAAVTGVAQEPVVVTVVQPQPTAVVYVPVSSAPAPVVRRTPQAPHPRRTQESRGYLRD